MAESKDREYAARLFLAWANDRYRRKFALTRLDGPVWLAEDAEDGKAGGRIALVADRLFEAKDGWNERRAALEQRLDESRPGSYLLWAPPGGVLPADEPDQSEWVGRVVLAASRLASGRKGEARLPAKLTLAKLADEGGYASVVGGLSRHWTTITERVQGTFYIDSRAIHRFTRDEAEREQLFEHIALLSKGLDKGNAVEFEHADAWSVQRLPRGPAASGLTDGWAITGCPDGFDPSDGAAIRRLLRVRLAAATLALGGHTDAVRALVLVGAYDYIEAENAGPALRGFDPALAAAFDVAVVVADAEVKPIILKRSLPW
jgi:hypothetical protein